MRGPGFARLVAESQVAAGLVPAISIILFPRCDRLTLYILASRTGGAIYVGVTNDLIRRVFEHRSGAVDGFTRRYNIKQLVYFGQFDSIHDAIQREKNIKHWPRAWKTRLIYLQNPTWRDLYPELLS